MDRIYYLLSKLVRNELTKSEREELEVLSKGIREYEELVAELADENLLLEGLNEMDGLKGRIERKMTSPPAPLQMERGERPSKVRTLWVRISVAASVAILLGLGVWFGVNRKLEGENRKLAAKQDIEAPRQTKATITLASGKKISIDSLTSMDEKNVRLARTENGEIAYSGNANEIVYNVLDNPRGSKVVTISLSDGTKVWLNAESSLKYPIAFVGGERKVEITGEAYFEVSHDASKPFYVSKGDVEVKVLGTHFNVNAYDDEANIKVTLLEGSVKVSKNGLTGLLKPGQQAQVDGEIRLIDNADTERVMAWKNGMFSFERADIKTIMREVSRWYDVDVVYMAEVKELFRFKTSRNTSVSNIFKILETTGGVHLEVDGKKIIVRP